jgi:hypothetical protein
MAILVLLGFISVNKPLTELTNPFNQLTNLSLFNLRILPPQGQRHPLPFLLWWVLLNGAV